MTTGILSDYNVSGQRPTEVALPELFSDIPVSFTEHPIKEDILPITDIDSIKQSVKNLVLTRFYDIPFHPEIGNNTSALLFENADIFTGMALKTEVVSILEKYEKRIDKIDVEIYDMSDLNTYHLVIKFRIRNNNVFTEININLKRLR